MLTWESYSDICKIILAVLLPPLGVFLERGCGGDLLINILLTILGYIPGIIHALYVFKALPRLIIANARFQIHHPEVLSAASAVFEPLSDTSDGFRPLLVNPMIPLRFLILAIGLARLACKSIS